MVLRITTSLNILPISLLRFLVVGVANTMVGLGTIWVAHDFFGTGVLASNVIGYLVGITVSFTLNRRWSFSFRGDGLASLLRFLLVFVVAYAANVLAVFAATFLSGGDSFWCQACGVLPYTTLFYLGCRWYAFPVGHDSRDEFDCQ